MSFSFRAETRELNEQTRKEASGSFIRLSDGFTHYELSNPHAKETVVLVHGFSVPYFIFDPTFEFLTRAGFRAVRYDLFGRGFSDRPDVPYGIELFLRQLGDLLDALHLEDHPVSLVGLSTGGPITASFTARFPGRVSKLVLIDPVGAGPFALARIVKVLATPLVGEAIVGLLGNMAVARRIAASSVTPENTRQFGERYLVQMHYRGFRRAVLSTVRNRMLDSFLSDYERIGKINKPVLLLWGTKDTTVPFQHSAILRAAMPQVEFHAMEDSGHIPHYEKPEEVNPILLRFLRG